MANSCEAFSYAAQSAIGTFVAPTISLRADSAGANGSQWEVSEERKLGSCRGLANQDLGARPAGGNLVTDWFDAGIATLFKTFMRDVTTSGSSPYVHGFIYDDSQDLSYFSGQLYYASDLALSILGGVVNSWELSVVKKERAKLTFNWEAKDTAESSDNSSGDGLFWHYNPATNTPNITDPATLYPTSGRGLWFYDAAIYRGGTFQFNPTTQRMTVAAPTQLSTIHSLTIAVNHNMDTDGYFLAEDYTRGAFCPQNRDIELTLDFDWCDQSMTIWRLAEAGAPFGLKVTLLKTATLGAELYFPEIFLKPFALPDTSGDKAKRTFSVSSKAQSVDVTNTTSGTTKIDMNLVILNNEASI
jgi:hypothetical protein